MSRPKWKTVIGGVEKTHRSETAAYDFLLDWAAGAADGERASVYEQERESERWLPYEHLQALKGLPRPW